MDRLLPELADRQVLRRPDGPLTDTVGAERAVTLRDLLTFTWGFGMQGAMFMASEPWPIVTAVAERQLASFGPAQPVLTQRAVDETGMPAVCDEVLSWASASR